MGSTAEVKEASYLGPTASADTTVGATLGVVRLATTGTTPVTAALPTVTLPGSIGSGVKVPLQNKYMDVKNESTTNAMNFAFGVGSAPALVYGQLSTFAAPSAAAGWHLGPGETKSIIVPVNATHVSVVAAAGTDTVAFYCSEGRVGDK